jgi:hypothetical protein
MAKPLNSSLQTAETQVVHESLLKTSITETQGTSATSSYKQETIMSQLYDIESSYSEPERSLPLDLDLDQIENDEE